MLQHIQIKLFYSVMLDCFIQNNICHIMLLYMLTINVLSKILNFEVTTTYS